ncbi:MAG: hypothetical protein WBN77_13795 [Desulfobacterales bacterium]
MIQIGTKKRLIMDSFIIVAIIVMVINIYLLTDIIGSPIAQKSELFKMADLKWQQYKQMRNQVSDDPTENSDTITAVAGIMRQIKPEKPQLLAAAQDNTEEVRKTSGMPHLSGILQVAGAGKSLRFIALMEGKRLYKNDKIMNFTIKNITAKGVLLYHNGQTSFVPAPEVYFSLAGNQTPAGAESR